MPLSFAPPSAATLAEIDRFEGVQYSDGCVVVEGVISPHEGSVWVGARQPNCSYDVYLFAFAGWRLAGEQFVGLELTLLQPVPPSNAGDRKDHIYEQFPDYSIQRFNVLLSKDQKRAIIEKVLSVETRDETLVSFSDRLRKPVVIPTDQFGDVVLDPFTGMFEATAKWNRKKVALRIEKGEDGTLDATMKTAEVLWANQSAWARRMSDFAIEKLLPLKNKSWRDDGEPKVKPKEFATRMKLMSIHVSGNGQFEFWHNDDNVFLGHHIQISGNLKDGPTAADIPG